MKKGIKILAASIMAAVLIVIPSMGAITQVVNAAEIALSEETPASSFTFESSTGTITEFTGSESNVVIPSQINGVAVTSIGEYAFIACEIESIEIPTSVKSIGAGAFYYCENLNSIKLSEGLESIDENAFQLCSTLTAVDLPASVKEINTTSFSNCENLEKINVSENNTSYSSQEGILFNKDKSEILIYPTNSSIKNYTIPSSVKVINENAFKFSKIEEITFNNNINSIPNNLFYCCLKLKKVDFSASINSIGNYAFQYCGALTDIEIPDSVKELGTSIFSDCTSLESVKLPSDIMSIPAGIFSRCSSITEFTIPDSVTTIGTNAFSGATALSSINLPQGLTSIGTGAFKDCSKITEITIPDNITIIEDSAFSGTGISSVTIPKNVTELKTCAFSNCSSLKTIYFSANISTISFDAFYADNNISDVYCYAGTAAANFNYPSNNVNIHYLGIFTNSPKAFDHTFSATGWTIGTNKLSGGTSATIDVNADGILCMELAAPSGTMVVKNNGAQVASISGGSADSPNYVCIRLNDSGENTLTFDVTGSTTALISNLRVADAYDASLDGKIDLRDAIAAKSLVGNSSADKLAIAAAADDETATAVTNYNVASLLRRLANI